MKVPLQFYEIALLFKSLSEVAAFLDYLHTFGFLLYLLLIRSFIYWVH
jgi:hypothetical protein